VSTPGQHDTTQPGGAATPPYWQDGGPRPQVDTSYQAAPAPLHPQVDGYAPPVPGPQPGYPAPAYGPGYVTDKGGKSVQAIVAWVLTILTLGYMLPWAIAATRGKSNAGMIGVVNLLLGWTFVGWIVALVMACGAHQIASAPTNVTVMTAVATGYPPPYGPQQGYQPGYGPQQGYQPGYGPQQGYQPGYPPAGYPQQGTPPSLPQPGGPYQP
jgi:fumarate reductase subunit D